MPQNNLKAARILIVDDQEANVQFLEGLLRQGQYHNHRSLFDSRDVARVCPEYQPDLILLDLMMPHLDGYGVLDQLRPWLDTQAYLPVLVLTADVNPESRRRALAAGAKDFLAKPLDAIEVLLRIGNLLETRFLYLELRRRADERIREQAELLDRANDAILVRDMQDRITYWNEGAERLYGWVRPEVEGRNANEVLFSRSQESLEEAQRAVLQAGTWSGELRQRTKDGREVIVASRWSLVRDEGGPSGQTLPLYQVPETQPEAGLHPDTLVLPELSPGNGASHIPCRLNRPMLPGVRGR